MFRKFSFVLMLLGNQAVADTPSVLTDIPAVHSLVSQVMQGVGSPEILLDRGSSPHTFQLRPSQAGTLSNADVLFWVGPELTPWLERAIDGIGVKGANVELLHSEGTIRRKYENTPEKHAENEHDEHAEGEHEHKHSGLDPHAWLEPQNAIIWLDIIAAELGKIDTQNAGQYNDNARMSKERITKLIAETEIALKPIRGKAMIVSHKAYGYFANRFDLHIAGVFRDGDATPPSAQQLAKIQEMIRGKNITCAFAEPSHEIINAMFRGTDISIGMLDPGGNRIKFGPDLYETLIRNMTTDLAICNK